MVSKVKPNYGRDAGSSGCYPPLSQKFIDDVINLLQITESDHPCFFKEMESIIGWHFTRKHQDKEKDTAKQIRQAAIDIKSQARKLAEMLYGSAGGMQPWLDDYISRPFRHLGTHIFLEEFNYLLKAVEDGCDYYLNDVYPNRKSNSASNLNLIFTHEVMDFYRSYFNKEPSTYLPADGYDYEPSEFVKFLKLCLTEANICLADSSLTRLMSKAKNYKKGEK